MAIFLNDTQIPGYQLKVAATLTLAGEDLSGQSSYTQQAETGDKPKSLSVSCNIKYLDKDHLSLLVNLAEARNQNNERTIYTIVNETAKAMNIRQMRFQGDVNVREMQTLEAWSISFKLVEYLSVPEKKEQRAASKPVKDQAALDQPIISQTVDVAAAVEQHLSFFEEHVLKKVDDILSD